MLAIFPRLRSAAHYNRYFDTVEHDGLLGVEAGHEAIHARRLHAITYLERGYIRPEDVHSDGSIALSGDAHRDRSRYFVVVRDDNPAPLAAARFIEVEPEVGLDSLQTWAELKLSERGRRLVSGYRPELVVEVSGLVKAKGVGTRAVMLLYRVMWQYALSHGLALWLMACDERLLRRLRLIFGEAVTPIGPPQFFKGHTVVPTVVVLDSSLDRLLWPGFPLPGVGRLKRSVARFFLHGLPVERLSEPQRRRLRELQRRGSGR